MRQMLPLQRLPRCSPAQAGVDPAAIARWLEAIDREGIQMNSFQLLRSGRVFAEGWWAPYAPWEPHVVHSFTKSVCATAIGILQEEGRLSVEDRVIDFFPDYSPPHNENLAQMRIRHLLTMTCGHGSEPRRDVVDLAREFLYHPVTHRPGEYYLYNSMASYMLAAIVRRVSGQNMTDYLRFRLFEPLGIFDVWCERCPLGTDLGGGGLLLRTEDMSKLAQLYLQRGRWNGRQLVPLGWIEEATRVHSHYQTPDNRVHLGPDSLAGYGYQIWRCSHPGAFRFDGAYGQYGVVIPSHDAVVVTTASSRNCSKIVERIWSHLLPGYSPWGRDTGGDPLEPPGLRLQWTAYHPPSPMAGEIDGKVLALPAGAPGLLPQAETESRPPDPRMVPRPTGLERIAVEFEESRCRIRAYDSGQLVEFSAGTRGTPHPGLLNAYANTYRIASTATWLDRQTLRLDIRLLNKAYHRTLDLCYDARGAAVTFGETPAPVPDRTLRADWCATRPDHIAIPYSNGKK